MNSKNYSKCYYLHKLAARASMLCSPLALLPCPLPCVAHVPLVDNLGHVVLVATTKELTLVPMEPPAIT